MFSKKYANTLLANFNEGVALLEKSYQTGTTDKNNQPYAIDQYWKRLQMVSIFSKNGKTAKIVFRYYEWRSEL